MTRKKIGVLAALAFGLTSLTGLSVAVAQAPNPFSVQNGQLCVRATCVSSSGHVTTYQQQPDLVSAPPSAGR